jgi:hypothetical protein
LEASQTLLCVILVKNVIKESKWRRLNGWRLNAFVRAKTAALQTAHEIISHLPSALVTQELFQATRSTRGPKTKTPGLETVQWISRFMFPAKRPRLGMAEDGRTNLQVGNTFLGSITTSRMRTHVLFEPIRPTRQWDPRHRRNMDYFHWNLNDFDLIEWF